MNLHLGASPSRTPPSQGERRWQDVPSNAALWRPALWACLRHPRAQTRAFAELQGEGNAGNVGQRYIPYRLWAALGAIAIGGSLLFGAALGASLPEWRAGRGALWLALSAGLSWLLFGPLLVWMARRDLLTCAHACLVTMAYGEAVLIPGAVLLWLRASWPNLLALPPAVWGIGLVGVSNLVMAAVFAAQMDAIGVPPRRSLACWIVALDGSGALLFALFARLLQG